VIDDIEQQAQRVIAVMREVGINPGKALASPMARQIAMQWSVGDLDEIQMMRAFRNLTILDPRIKVD
jgi:hypothetical protein